MAVNFTYYYSFLARFDEIELFEWWGMGVVKGRLSDFFIIIFEFYVPKLVSVQIFSLVASLVE